MIAMLRTLLEGTLLSVAVVGAVAMDRDCCCCVIGEVRDAEAAAAVGGVRRACTCMQRDGAALLLRAAWRAEMCVAL